MLATPTLDPPRIGNRWMQKRRRGMPRGEGGREREEGEGGISGCGIGSLGYLGNHIKV